MNADLLDRALDELVDRCDNAFGDWEDVLRRANISAASPLAPAPCSQQHRPFSRRRRLLIAVAIALLIFGVLMATPAFGVRGAVLGLFGRTNLPFGSSKSASALVRRNFTDLNLGAPPSLAPQAIASESREVTTFHVNGKSHTLWVAPRRDGGFCWETSKGPGGCLNLRAIVKAFREHPKLLANQLAHGAIHPQFLSVTYLMQPAGGQPSTEVAGLQVVVLTPKAARLVAEFRGGKAFDLPFVFVSPPINAGFAYWHIPAVYESTASGLSAVTVYDAHGGVLARYPTPTFQPVPRHTTPATSPPSQGLNTPAPTAPLRHGSGDGVSITIGANGVVVFSTTGLDAARRAVLRGSFGVDCFHLAHDSHGLFPMETGVVRSLGPEIKVQLFGVPMPYDGCEMQATYGHTWPDKRASHSAVEIPLSTAGRRFFADRAAARDLALFVRSKRGRAIRHKAATVARGDLAKVRPRLIAIPSAAAKLPVGKIGYLVTRDGVTFVEQSPTGKRFQIVTVHGRIASQNVKPYAFVF